MAKCLNLPAKCDSPVAECRSLSLKPQQELTPCHVPGCHGADWLVVKLRVARYAGKCSFKIGCHIPLYCSLFVTFLSVSLYARAPCFEETQ